jgi:hypothetical protein
LELDRYSLISTPIVIGDRGTSMAPKKMGLPFVPVSFEL